MRFRLLAGVASVLALAAAVVAVASRGEGAARPTPTSPDVRGAFGPHYAGLAARRAVAGVPTMMETMRSRAHFHVQLTVFADGRRVPVPANVGIDPRRPAMQMADLHTHDASGLVHVEGMERARLGQFFRVWGVDLGADRLGPYRSAVRMWVDGKRSQALGRLRLADGQRITLAVGRGGPLRP